jgi:hypothetical protein
LEQWAAKRGFRLPHDDFFADLRKEFTVYASSLLPSFEMVSERELVDGIARLVSSGGLMPVSLDQVYTQSLLRLDVTRAVDRQGNDLGLVPRSGYDSVSKQMSRLQDAGANEVVLIDDVLFEGNLMSFLIKTLRAIDIKVPLVYVGIGIGSGINRVGKLGCEVRCVREFDTVVDEVCERDFYPGVPQSGRLLDGSNDVGLPYVLPWGNPTKWASIPDVYTVRFSHFCITQTVKLFRVIERESKRSVTVGDLDRGLPETRDPCARFVDVLEAAASVLLIRS